MDASTPLPSDASPMVVAYAAAQAAAPGHLVLYRVGEFYEVLGDDAATVSRLLGIQLTRRRQKNAPDIPMCGIPAGLAEAAIARLLAAERKVAVSEQPAEPGGERPLRLLTPGTSVDADVLSAGKPNTLVVAHTEGETVALAWTDLSTGESGTCMASLSGCAAALARIVPSEILVSRWPEGSEALALAVRGSGARFSNLPGDGLPPDEADAVLACAYGSSWREMLRGFSPLELTAHAALLDYVHRVVGTLPASLPLPRRVSAGDTVEIDGPTLRGLDVLTSSSGRDGSLLSAHCLTLIVTDAGRCLRWFATGHEWALRDLVRKRKKPVVLIVDEAHDLHHNTLTGLKRLIEMVADGGGKQSVLLAGWPRLRNDLRSPNMEEIGYRTTVFSLEGVTGSQREYIGWVLGTCAGDRAKVDGILDPAAVDLLASRLRTPLQIEQHLTLALETGYQASERPVGEAIVASVLSKQIDDLEPTLMRHGYTVKVLCELLGTKPAEVRALLRQTLEPDRAREMKEQLLAAGLRV